MGNCKIPIEFTKRSACPTRQANSQAKGNRMSSCSTTNRPVNEGGDCQLSQTEVIVTKPVMTIEAASFWSALIMGAGVKRKACQRLGTLRIFGIGVLEIIVIPILEKSQFASTSLFHSVNPSHF